MKLLNTIHLFDLRAFDWCLQRHYRKPMIHVSRWISKSADGHLYAIMALLAMVMELWVLVQLLAVGFTVERMVYFLLKQRLKRRRPQQAIPFFTSVIQPSDQFSFPSGHTSAAFFMMGILSTLYPVLAMPLLLWAAMVGVSRVMLGVHFPSDIFAGALLGYGMSMLTISLLFL